MAGPLWVEACVLIALAIVEADVLTRSIGEGMLLLGVQDASRLRTGPSPPERDSN